MNQFIQYFYFLVLLALIWIDNNNNYQLHATPATLPASSAGLAGSAGMVVSSLSIMELKSPENMAMAIQSRNCDKFIDNSLSKENYFTITSPNYPNEYHNSTDCYRIIVAPNPSDTLTLEWDNFEIEPSPDCSYDYIEIHDGPFGFSPFLAKLCNRYKHQSKTIASTGRYLWLWFHSDSTHSDKGFIGKISIIKQQSASTVGGGGGGVGNDQLRDSTCFISLLLPNDEFILSRDELLNHLIATRRIQQTHVGIVDCTVLLYVPPPYQITIHFEKVRFPSKNELCQKTRMDFYDGFSNPSHNITICSRSNDRPLNSTNGRGIIRLYATKLNDLVNFTAVVTRTSQAPCLSLLFDCGDEKTCVNHHLVCNQHHNCPNSADERCIGSVLNDATEPATLEVTHDPADHGIVVKKKEDVRHHYVILGFIGAIFALFTCVCCILSIHQKKVPSNSQVNHQHQPINGNHYNLSESPSIQTLEVNHLSPQTDNFIIHNNQQHQQQQQQQQQSRQIPYRSHGIIVDTEKINPTDNDLIPLTQKLKLNGSLRSNVTSSLGSSTAVLSPPNTKLLLSDNKRVVPIAIATQNRIGRYLAVQNPIIPQPVGNPPNRESLLYTETINNRRPTFNKRRNRGLLKETSLDGTFWSRTPDDKVWQRSTRPGHMKRSKSCGLHYTTTIATTATTTAAASSSSSHQVSVSTQTQTQPTNFYYATENNGTIQYLLVPNVKTSKPLYNETHNHFPDSSES